ncbi:toxin-antitoxin system protein [Gordonia phthalatica]|uniref:Toxin-antitoxin system protein n=2 Tax=Gordonia phthalatica TaxID=1136941 RepID=A0A0N9NF03_9ACTN|nr:toxin-antitoxin system protein [Gordonia phthalatica]
MTSRIEVRAEDELIALIRRAANAVHEPASEFVRKAALARADIVLREDLITVMSAEQFDDMAASLDTADEAVRLAEESRRPRVFSRR